MTHVWVCSLTRVQICYRETSHRRVCNSVRLGPPKRTRTIYRLTGKQSAAVGAFSE